MCAQLYNDPHTQPFKGRGGIHPQYLSIKDFTYVLPDEAIAKYPLAERDQSKLLISKDEQIEEDIYANLANHLPNNTLLVFNNTKVVEARILFKKASGGNIEIFCLEPHAQYPDITTAMQQKGKVWWKCLVGGAKKWKDELLTLTIKNDLIDLTLTAQKIEQLSDSYVIELCWDNADISFAEILHRTGLIPLPPYLNRLAEESDKERYQTIYAKYDGSVAAPTAGLHFTDQLFEKLKIKNIQHDFVSLHVGAGTFKPVKSETMQSHEMHAEFIDVSKSFIENLLQHLQKNVIAVGTTSLRTIESMYWIGVKLTLNPQLAATDVYITQWEPYEFVNNDITVQESLQSLLTWLDKQPNQRLVTKTQIIIAPGYHFRIAKALITNFHQPQSTLLLLVAAMIGDKWKKVYEYALENQFRFLSYGDGSLLWLS